MPWEQLVAAIKSNIKSEENERDQPPEYCPHDGAVLVKRGNVRNCPMGNFRWEG